MQSVVALAVLSFAIAASASDNLRGSQLQCESALSLVEQAEGFRACMYKDTRGIPTICYGYNLENSNAREEIAKVGGNYDSVMRGGCLSQSQCQQLLQTELVVAEQGAQSVFGSQCGCIQAVLVDMTYNLGRAGIASFTTFRSYIESHNWSAASNDLYGTLWCKQVGNRCSRDAGIIARGC